MQFDDRLTTVLRRRAAGDRAARTQFRQLLDLLGSSRTQGDGKLMTSAWLRLGALSEMIPARDRAAIINEPGMRFRNPELVAHLAEDEPEVAAAALAHAQLAEEDWNTLIPRLPVRARGFLRLRRDLPSGTADILDRLGIHDRGLPGPDAAAAEPEQAPSNVTPIRPVALQNTQLAPEPANDEPLELRDEEVIEEDSEIGALVKRIEAFRSARKAAPVHGEDPRLPLGEKAPKPAPVDSFSFTANASGKIDWADLGIAPMIVGTVLNHDSLSASMQFLQPVRGAAIRLAGAPRIAGEWIVDAAPRFTRPGGRFFGYAGIFRRQPVDQMEPEEPVETSEADRLRQLLHELKTPVNAIQGFSEVIQQQLFGPTPHEYRALAANIAGDSARMLAGFDELDRLAKLETGALDLETGECDFGSIVAEQIGQLQDVLRPRTAEFDFTPLAAGPTVLAQHEAETLSWRILATLAGSTGAGEHLQIELAEQGGWLRLCCSLPISLADAADIFAATAKPAKGAVSAGMFGAGFTLRLAKAEARSTGGDLSRVDDWLLLTLPLLTRIEAQSSPNASGSVS